MPTQKVQTRKGWALALRRVNERCKDRNSWKSQAIIISQFDAHFYHIAVTRVSRAGIFLVDSCLSIIRCKISIAKQSSTTCLFHNVRVLGAINHYLAPANHSMYSQLDRHRTDL